MPFKGVFEDNGKIVSYLDELRYFIMSRPKSAEKCEEVSPVLQDKLRRIRSLRRGVKKF